MRISDWSSDVCSSDLTGNFDEFATASSQTIIAALGESALPNLLDASEAMTVQAHGAIVTYSRKVFIPLTKLCRDVCHYCTFAQTPKAVERPDRKSTRLNSSH